MSARDGRGSTASCVQTFALGALAMIGLFSLVRPRKRRG